MAREAVPSDDRSALAVQDVVARARDGADDLGREMWDRVLLSVPGVESWDEALLEAGPLSAAANVRALAAVLDPGVGTERISAPMLGLAHARQAARTGTTLAALLQVYQLGHEVWRGFYVQVLEDHAESAADLIEFAQSVSDATFRYLSEVSAEVAEAYEEESRRLGESGERGRLQAVRQLLSGEDADPDTAAVRLGLDLRASHTALVAWVRDPVAAGDPEALLEVQVRRVAEALGIARPLVVTSGTTTAFAWLSRARPPSAAPLEERLAGLVLDAPDVVVACGREALGADGFRGSHQEALATRRFADNDHRAGGLLLYPDVELASLLAVDRERSGAFVRRELGGLAADDPGAERLRATLEALLAAESSTSRAAERLGVHKNTVLYRVRQAEEARGEPLHHRRLELETALRLARELPALLSPP